MQIILLILLLIIINQELKPGSPQCLFIFEPQYLQGSQSGEMEIRE